MSEVPDEEPGPIDLLVVEFPANSWAAPFSAAARESGAQLIANERIHTQALIAALEADEEEESD